MKKIVKYRKRKQFHIGKFIGILFICMVGLSFLTTLKNEVAKGPISEDERIYDTIYNEIKDYKTSFSVGQILDTRNGQAVYEPLHRVQNDNPEFFWLMGGASLVGAKGDFYTLTVNSRCDMEQVPDMKQKMDSIVHDIVTYANYYCKTDYEKALYVHDYLIKTCVYDEKTYEKYLQEDGDGSSLSYTAYGCICTHTAVCAGYAKAYMLILKELGIECGYVTGKARNSDGIGNHAWNYIKLDDGYYMVDVTWDDPIGGDDSICSRKYFCLTSEMMEKDHFADSEQWVPECKGKKFVTGGR